MKETTYNAPAIEEGTIVPEPSINERNLNETSVEGGFTLDKSLANGTNNNATTFLDKLSDRADKLSDKALLEYTKHRSVADQLTQNDKIGVTAVALTLLITCGCCCWKRQRGTKIPKKGGKPGAQMTKYKEPLVQVKVEERPWTNHSFFKWEAKKGRIEYANGDVYEGELSDGQPCGWGVLRSPYATHEGEWKDGKKHGKGVLKYVDGDEYEGEWKEGKKFGQGNFRFSCIA
jgi:hypothetical protein